MSESQKQFATNGEAVSLAMTILANTMADASGMTSASYLERVAEEIVNAIAPLFAPSETPRTETFLGPCSCADNGKCKHNSEGPLCMQEGTSVPSSNACRAALANIMARIDGDEFIPTEYKEDARKALASALSAIGQKKDWGRAKVGLDGDHGYALLGEDLQSGEAEFSPIEGWPTPTYKQERAAWGLALKKLEERLGSGLLRYEVIR